MKISEETKKYRHKVINQYLARSKGVLHLGAHLGQECLTYHDANKKVIWVEANPLICSKLIENLNQFPEQMAFCALLDKVNGLQRDFKISNNADGVSSSIYDFGEYGCGEKSLWKELNLCMSSSVRLPTTRLDALIEQNDIDCSEFEYWVVDVQGAELLVLEGAGSCIKYCKSIYIEVSKVEIYQNGVLWDELRQWLKKNGFIPLWEPMLPHDDVLCVHQCIYQEVEKEFRSEAYLRHNSRRLEHLASLNLPLSNRRVLEVGAGIGDHTSFYLDRGCTVTVTDVRPEILDVLRVRFEECSNVNIRILDMENPDLFDDGEYYDIIHCYGILYHLKDPESAICYLAKKGNLLLLETCITNNEFSQVNNLGEPSHIFSQSFYGVGCRPGHKYLLSILSKFFKSVRVCESQPYHSEFKSNSNLPQNLYRKVYIAEN